MQEAPLKIVACPSRLVREALSLVMTEISPETRQDVLRGVLPNDTEARRVEGLFVALHGDALCAATWAQQQAGDTAMLWPPQWNCAETPTETLRLVGAATVDLDSAGIGMAQVLLPSRDANIVPTLEAVGFHHLADLLYLTSEATTFPDQPPDLGELRMKAYEATQRKRLEKLVERTYEGTRDCIELNGRREMGDVLDGYAATGSSGTKHWYLISADDQDVGVLLIAEHSGPRHWELMYMGIVPEVRGRGWGLRIARWAQWLARRARAERLVLAVDAVNQPALTVYRDAGFFSWDARTVYARFGAASPAAKTP